MRLIVRDRDPGDAEPTLSFSDYVHLMDRAAHGDQDAINKLNEWAKGRPSHRATEGRDD